MRNISFNVRKGEALGVIGPNGSGKTTLLKILAGIIFPTNGEIKVDGRVSTLFELGTGFHPDLTGRENIFLNGAVLGISRKDLESKFDQIVDFSELGKFIEMPLKHYSSGMQVRLAFSVAINVNPEILLVDEVLAVGDAAFQEKSFSAFEKFKKEGTTIVFVSHDIGKIEEFCDRALYFRNAKLEADGPAHSVILKYLYQSGGAPGRIKRRPRGFIGEVKCLNLRGEEASTFQTGEDLTLRIKFGAKVRNYSPLNLGIAVLDQNKAYVYGVNTFLDKIKVPRGASQAEVVLRKLPLFSGHYSLAVAIHGKRESDILEYVDNAAAFRVISYGSGAGTTFIDHEWKF